LGRALVLAVLALLVAAPLARADGDPASDFLLGQPSFIPFDDGVPKAYAEQLVATIAAAKARGYTVRVALIGRPYDLGSVTILWRKPKRYAPFLAQELWFVYRGRVLVVMPNGYAIARHKTLIAREQPVLDRLRAPGHGAALAAAATNAVVRLAANAGVVIEAAPLGASSKSSSQNGDRVKIAVAVLVVLLLLGAGAFVRRRKRRPA